ncbi:MAG: Gfo/Idh/MocA family oxidoreductase [Bacteroidota bacterium]
MITRRKFFRQATLTALAASFGNCVWRTGGQPQQSKEKTDKKSIGVALVGLGYYSRDLLAPALQLTQHCHLAGIVTGSPDKIPVWQQRYDIKDANVYNYDNMDRIADNPDIDVIYIVLPTGLHAKYAIKAANTGKHVWCEKPMARTAAECQSIIDACRKNKVKLSIGYRMQHEPNTQRVMGLGRKRPFGKILNITAEAGYRESRAGHWKLDKSMGGGAMYDMGVYPLNAARYSAQEEPIAVAASHEITRPQLYTEVDEITRFKLEFPSGAIANGMVSFAGGYNHLKVDCEKAWYELKPFQSYSGVSGQMSDGTQWPAFGGNQQAKQMDDDALAILNDTPVMVPGEDGLKDIAIVEAIYKSAASGTRVAL